MTPHTNFLIPSHGPGARPSSAAPWRCHDHHLAPGGRHSQPEGSSQPLHVSFSYRPTLLPQQGGDSPIPVTAMLFAELPHPLEQPLLLAGWLFAPIPVRRPRHLQKPARRPPGTQLAGHHRPSGSPSLLRAYNFFSHTASSTRFLSRLSASIFFNSVFSLSSSFKRLASLISICPN